MMKEITKRFRRSCHMPNGWIIIIPIIISTTAWILTIMATFGCGQYEYNVIFGISYGYDRKYFSGSATIGVRYSQCGGLEWAIEIPEEFDYQSMETDISILMTKIEENLDPEDFQLAYTYGLASTIIGGMTMASMYFGLIISYGRRAMACITIGFCLASSFAFLITGWVRMAGQSGFYDGCTNGTQICVRLSSWYDSPGWSIALWAGSLWSVLSFFSCLIVCVPRFPRLGDRGEEGEEQADGDSLEIQRERGGQNIIWEKRVTNVRAAPDNMDASDKEVAIIIVSKDRHAFRYAPKDIRSDKDVVLAAVSNNSEMLKFALGGLNQDRDCWIAAGLWSEGHDLKKKANRVLARIALSTKFSLGEKTNSSVTNFTKCLSNHWYFRDGDFAIYSPNAFSKNTCDPEWTRIDWPCRGTFETCKKDPEFKTGTPQDACCWRYSFRWHLEEAQKTRGFMLQVVDLEGKPLPFAKVPSNYALGKGQEIESEMAAAVGTKVFRIYRPRALTARGQWLKEFNMDHIDSLAKAVQGWYDESCEDMSVHEIFCDERLE